LELRRTLREDGNASEDADDGGASQDQSEWSYSARILLRFGLRRIDGAPIVVGPGRGKRVVLYTELRGLAGETISHRWERDEQTMAVVPFQVRGDRWRVHSSKRLTPALRGSWKVAVTDAHGAVLASRSFLVR
jgi:hypothetical protein